MKIWINNTDLVWGNFGCVLVGEENKNTAVRDVANDLYEGDRASEDSKPLDFFIDLAEKNLTEYEFLGTPEEFAELVESNKSFSMQSIRELEKLGYQIDDENDTVKPVEEEEEISA